MLVVWEGIDQLNLDPVSHFEDLEAQNHILYFLPSLKIESVKKIQSSKYYEVMYLIPVHNGYKIFEKCACCNKKKHSIKEINHWSINDGFEERFQISN